MMDPETKAYFDSYLASKYPDIGQMTIVASLDPRVPGMTMYHDRNGNMLGMLLAGSREGNALLTALCYGGAAIGLPLDDVGERASLNVIHLDEDAPVWGQPSGPTEVN